MNGKEVEGLSGPSSVTFPQIIGEKEAKDNIATWTIREAYTEMR